MREACGQAGRHLLGSLSKTVTGSLYQAALEWDPGIYGTRVGWAQGLAVGYRGVDEGSALHELPLGADLRSLTMGSAECPPSSPRPDIGEVYTDGVLLVWKPMESCGPVTYIVQCSLEGRAVRVSSSPGGSVASGESTWPLCASGDPSGKSLIPSVPVNTYQGSLGPCAPLGSLNGLWSGRPGAAPHLLHVVRWQLEHTGLGHL